MSQPQPEPNHDHSEGFLLLRFIKGKLRLFRIRNLADALARGGPFE